MLDSPPRGRRASSASKPSLLGQQRRRAFELLAADARHIPAPARPGASARAAAPARASRAAAKRLAGLGERLGRRSATRLARRRARRAAACGDLGLARRRFALERFDLGRVRARARRRARCALGLGLADARAAASARRCSASAPRGRASRPPRARRRRGARGRRRSRGRGSPTSARTSATRFACARSAAARAASTSASSAAASGSAASAALGASASASRGRRRSGARSARALGEAGALARRAARARPRPHPRRAPPRAPRARPRAAARARFGGVARRASTAGRAPIARGLGVGDRRVERGQRRLDLGEPVDADQPLGRRRAAAGRDEAVPAPQPPVAGDQPLADGERLPVVASRRRRPAPAGGASAGGRLDMVEQARSSPAASGGSPACGSLPCPAARPVAAERGVEILAERRGERALIAGRGLADRPAPRRRRCVERPRQRIALRPWPRSAPRAPRRARFPPRRARRRPRRAPARRAPALPRPRPAPARPLRAAVARRLDRGAFARRRRRARRAAAPSRRRFGLDPRRLGPRGFERGLGDPPLGAHRRFAARAARPAPPRPRATRASAAVSSAAIRAAIASASASRASIAARSSLELRDRARRRRALSAASRAVSAASAASSRSSSASRRTTVSRSARAVASWWPSVAPGVARGQRRVAPLGERRGGLLLQRLRARCIACCSRATSPSAASRFARPPRPPRGRPRASGRRPAAPRRAGSGRSACGSARPPAPGAAAPRRALPVGEDFVEPGEIGLGRAQLLLGVLAADVEAGDPRRFLEHQPPLGRLGGDHRADLALADQRRRMGAGRGVGEQQGDVLGADVAAVDPIGRAGAALDPAGDLAFAVAARRRPRPPRARPAARLRRSRAPGASRCRRR